MIFATKLNRTLGFGLVTLTVLNTAAFMILIGIYNSAKLVSSNDLLRKSIRKYTLEMSKKDIELDEKELRRYIDFVVKEVKKRGVNENAK